MLGTGQESHAPRTLESVMREQVKNAAHVYRIDEIRSWSRYRIVLRTISAVAPDSTLQYD